MNAITWWMTFGMGGFGGQGGQQSSPFMMIGWLVIMLTILWLVLKHRRKKNREIKNNFDKSVIPAIDSTGSDNQLGDTKNALSVQRRSEWKPSSANTVGLLLFRSPAIATAGMVKAMANSVVLTAGQNGQIVSETSDV